MDHQFQFDKNRKRAELCPCGKSNKDGKFSPYKGFIDKGHCHSCGENFFPLKEKEFNPFAPTKWVDTKPTQVKPISFIDLNKFHKSLSQYDTNNFVTYLKTVFNIDLVDDVIEKYNIGTSKHWVGSTVFWQIDDLGNVRSGKIMLYDELSGKRVKKPFDHISWVHSVLKMPDFNLEQVFFGTHLIRLSSNAIAIVESEKTAIIASICFSNITWLAAGSKDGLKIEKFKPLKNRNIILFPDANAYELWSIFAEKHKTNFKIEVSSLIDQSVTLDEKNSGVDIADFLLRTIPQHLKPQHYQQSILEIKTYTVDPSKIETLAIKNPALNSLITKLSLEIDSNPSNSLNWQNDIPGTIKKIEQEIMPDTSYHIDDIIILIKKYHSAINNNFDKIIYELISKNVIIQNKLNQDCYYKYGSTPF